MKKITGLMGYTQSDPSLVWAKMDVVVEIPTNGEDSGGYKVAETLGVARSEYGNLCLFVGSINDNPVFDKHPVLHMATDGSPLSFLLRALADQLEELSL